MDELLRRTAIRIKQAYCKRRAAAHGVPSFTPGIKYNANWVAAAKLCIAQSIDPDEFIAAQFEAIKPYPHISAISSDKALERFHTNSSLVYDDEVLRLDLQVDALEKLTKLGHTTIEVLTDEFQNFDNIFIFCTLDIIGAPEAQQYEKAALDEYLLCPYKQKLYKDALPERFIELKERLKNG